jgi:alanine-synthesizing transaminase
MEFPRIKRLPPYLFATLDKMKMEARRAGEDIIDFGMGNPDHASPPHVVEKLVEAAGKSQNHRYSTSRGIFKLRLAICDWYKRRFDVELDPDTESIVTIGSKEGLAHLALAMLGPGDSPLFDCHSECGLTSRAAPTRRRFFCFASRKRATMLAATQNVVAQFSS